MNGVTQREWSFLLLLRRLSDPRIAELRKMPKSFIIKLYSETQVSSRLGMSGGISPRHAQNPLSGERRKTLSITHRFYRIIVSLKRPFVPKSDVKQWITTTLTRCVDNGKVPIPCPFRNPSFGCIWKILVEEEFPLNWFLTNTLLMKDGSVYTETDGTRSVGLHFMQLEN